jgi:CYTH domain-containing protein
MGIEIERKFTVKELPKDLDKYPFHEIEQGYLNVNPAVRVRRQDDEYYMTYKSSKKEKAVSGEIGQTEYNMSLDKASYEHLVEKADGNVIKKTRYLLPVNADAFDADYLEKDSVLKEMLDKKEIKIELDVFKAPFEGTIIAEVEFPSEEAASAYHMASWFNEDVTSDYHYKNSYMSSLKL